MTDRPNSSPLPARPTDPEPAPLRNDGAGPRTAQPAARPRVSVTISTDAQVDRVDAAADRDRARRLLASLLVQHLVTATNGQEAA